MKIKKIINVFLTQIFLIFINHFRSLNSVQTNFKVGKISYKSFLKKVLF